MPEQDPRCAGLTGAGYTADQRVLLVRGERDRLAGGGRADADRPAAVGGAARVDAEHGPAGGCGWPFRMLMVTSARRLLRVVPDVEKFGGHAERGRERLVPGGDCGRGDPGGQRDLHMLPPVVHGGPAKVAEVVRTSGGVA